MEAIGPLSFFFALIYGGFILGVVTDRLLLRRKRDTENQRPANPESGSIFTMLLAGIAMAGALGLVLYQTVSGPMSSMVRISNKTSAKTQMQSVSSIVIMDAINQANGGDCDADGNVEPRAWRIGAYGPTNGGLIPLTIGAPVTDPWATDYGYCVWDVGAQIKVAGCDGANGPNAQRLSGSPTPTAGNASTQTVLAVISAGPNRQFQSTCLNYVDATTDVITLGGDDLVQRFTYQEAASATSSLWTLKPSDTTQAIINKNLAIGPTATPTVTVNSTTGLISALGITTQGKISSGGAIQLATDAVVTTCLAANQGDMRYNATTKAIEVCDGPTTTWKSAGGGLWTDSGTGYISYLDSLGAMRVGQVATVTAPIAGATSSQWITTGSDIYYNTGNVGIGTTSPYGKTHVRSAASGAASAVAYADDLIVENNDNGGLSILVPNNKSSNIVFGDNDNNTIGYIEYRHTDDSLRFFNNAAEHLTLLSTGNVGIGTASPGAQLHLNDPASGEAIKISRGTGSVRFTKGFNQDNLHLFNSDASVNMMTWLGAGNVGIGTSNPVRLLTLDAAAAPALGFYTTGTERAKVSADTSNNLMFDTGNSEKVRITGAGYVGIGTTSPGAPLHIKGSMNGTGNCAIASYIQLCLESTSQYDQIAVSGTGGTAGYLQFNSSGGQWTNSGPAWVNASARKYKANISDSPYGLKEVLQYNPVRYTLKSDQTEKLHLGVIADDSKEIIPSLVTYKNGDVDAFNYTELIPVLIKAIQEQQAQIESRDAKNAALESRIKKLERALRKQK